MVDRWFRIQALALVAVLSWACFSTLAACRTPVSQPPLELVSAYITSSGLPLQGSGLATQASVTKNGFFAAYVSDRAPWGSDWCFYPDPYGSGSDPCSNNDHVYLKVQPTGEVFPVSAPYNGQNFSHFGMADHSAPTIADTGFVVAFVTTWSEQSSGDPEYEGQSIHVAVLNPSNLYEGPITRVADGHSPKLSGDGEVLAFVSDENDIVPGDTNGVADVFVHDRTSGSFERVNVSTAGEEANGASGAIALSNDGRFVAFSSDASNLVPDDSNGVRDVFIHDRDADTTTRVSLYHDGTESTMPSDEPSISRDGRYVAFVAFERLADDGVQATIGAEDESRIILTDTINGSVKQVSSHVQVTSGRGIGSVGEPSVSDAGHLVSYEFRPYPGGPAFGAYVYNIDTGAYGAVCDWNVNGLEFCGSPVSSDQGVTMEVGVEVSAAGDTNGHITDVVLARPAAWFIYVPGQ